MTNSARLARRGVLGLLLVSATGCTDWAGYDLDYLWSAIPALSTMRSSVTYDPYDMPRLPPENSVPLSTPNGNTPTASGRMSPTALGFSMKASNVIGPLHLLHERTSTPNTRSSSCAQGMR